MKMRLPSGGYWGWHLLIGVVVFAAMTIVLVALSDEVIDGEPLTLVDARLSAWLHANRTPAHVLIFKVITELGAFFVVTTGSLAVCIYLLWRKQRYWFTTFLLSVAGGVVLNRLLKSAFQRTRPQLDDPIMTFTGYSFPSGHTLTATVFWGCLAALIVANTKSKAIRFSTVVVASIIIALVGFSRIYLGAHFLTDVMAAIAEGLAWLALSFTLVYSLWRHKSVNSES
ncbi:MAG TPA: phosphatase PAP2 family protein [Pyrinomonadaceae bacterium]|nr:phosphatase PAP2 family protein [Pyrinomonadaceae bacterium]